MDAFFSDKPHSDVQDDEIDDAISRSKGEIDNQLLEIRSIVDAVQAVDQESNFILENLRATNVSRQEFSNAHSEPINSPRAEESRQQRNELMLLLQTYPESGFRANPCLETVEQYIEARRAHHESVLSIAEVLLPNLNSILNEAKLIRKTTMVPG